MKDLEKRKRVMQRSIRLGHCICNPRQACPCELLRTHQICQCAGERILSPGVAPRLTQLAKSPGCASKVPAGQLARVLSRLPPCTDPRLLVGSATADDAGVFQISPELCLVQTVDLFTPCVDDPYTFGRIAAANSLSDVYAMGGLPVTALSLLGYPADTLDEEVVSAMLRGGLDQLADAGVTLVGGHSINEEEVKLGFAVTGLVDPSRVVTNAGARPGDAVILTKPIGTGIVAFATQLGRASPAASEAAVASMTSLNNRAAEVMSRAGARACTDVTGFGLLGHLSHLARESGVSIEISWEAVPLLPEVLAYAEQGLVSGAAERNREFVEARLRIADDVPATALDLLCDPQTSGGLLLALPAPAAGDCLAELRAAGCLHAAVIGRVTEPSEGRLFVVQGTGRDMVTAAARAALPDDQNACCAATTARTPAACCPAQLPTGPAASTAGQAFERFMAAAFSPGALDVIQKELITLALSVALQCEPCLKTHLSKAASMGITGAEIEEAAWLGVAFGGAKAMMFWKGMGYLVGNKEPATGV